METINYD